MCFLLQPIQCHWVILQRFLMGSFFFRGLADDNYILNIIGPDGDDEGSESDYSEYNTPTSDPDENN